MKIAKVAGARQREDRLSTLSDATLGRILSSLPSKEAARAAVLSTRWRDTFTCVDAVWLEEPESPIVEEHEDNCGSDYGRPDDPDPKLPFTTAVTAALLARHGVHASPAPPLRALRVVFDKYRPEDAPAVDHWVFYALKQADRAPAGLELDLSLRREPLCNRPYCPGSHMHDMTQYSVPTRLFSCAALRTLSISIGPCSLSPPAAVSLPSLEVLLLARVSDHERHVQSLVDGCPRLADLTLETCATVTTLSLLGNHHLCRLALRCCHNLAKVFVAADGNLHSLEYRGDVPDTSLLDLQGTGRSSFTSCSIDISGKEVSSEELTKLGEFLQLVSSTKHLHLQSVRLGYDIQLDAPATLPVFTSLLHLKLTGRLLHGDATDAVSRILGHAPSLEVLSLLFETGPDDDELHARDRWEEECKVGEIVDAHQLRYNEHDVLATMPPVSIPCLRRHVREINLVHYHGGSVQRTLARFLLCNALVLDKLYCGFAPGPLWIQTKLRDEIQGWAMNSPKNCVFD
ncbi:putative F-box protein At3g44060 [Aegilops tauschii subsp. strangulata]|uniref:putative F-box protein At3g44060 n=1 Tax=Aegilops tauschii subsp. strangulata TaxID=200361 RepID=UPI003CC86CCE